MAIRVGASHFTPDRVVSNFPLCAPYETLTYEWDFDYDGVTFDMDATLLAWLEPGSSDDDEPDLLTTQAANELAMLLVE